MGLQRIPKIKPSKGTVYLMGIALGTFTYFFTRASTPTKPEAGARRSAGGPSPGTQEGASARHG